MCLQVVFGLSCSIATLSKLYKSPLTQVSSNISLSKAFSKDSQIFIFHHGNHILFDFFTTLCSNISLL